MNQFLAWWLRLEQYVNCLELSVYTPPAFTSDSPGSSFVLRQTEELSHICLQT
jgi:hypothetical protein